MTARKHISLKEKLAAALYRMATQYLHETAVITNDYTAFKKIVDCRYALMPAEKFNSLFHFDHLKFHCYGDEDRDRWWNLTPMLAKDHIEKTRKDLGIIAKGKRIQRKEAAHKAALARPIVATPAPPVRRKRRIASRPFAKRDK